MDREWAEETAYAAFGIHGRARALPGELDANFFVGSPAGKFVLKVAHPDRTVDELELENAAIEALGHAALPIATPEIVRSVDGAALWPQADKRGRIHATRLLTFLPGQLLAEAPAPSVPLLRDLGDSLARVDRVLSTLTSRAKRRGLRWDLAHAEWIAPYVQRLRDQGFGLVHEALLRFVANVKPVLDSLPKALIHNDANDHNVIVGGQRVRGLFDFGDMVQTARVFEPIVAAAYAAFRFEGAPQLALAQVAAGYHAVTPLTATEIDIFGDAVVARLATSVVASEVAADAAPWPDYANVSRDQAWALLAALHEAGPTRVRDAIRAACGHAVLPPRIPSKSTLLRQRAARLGKGLSLAYDEPLTIMRGRGQFLFDETDRPLLDAVNNVCHVGHCHPAVVDALADQARTLNTNTRYLHPTVLRLAQRLCATMPAHLEVCYFVCSGSEANELALRLARTATSRHDVAVLDHAYHGNTSGMLELSPYKWGGRGAAEPPRHVHVAAAPDPYRQASGIEGAEFARRTVGRVLADAIASGRPVAALFAESLPGCAGQVVPPPGYLAEAFACAREHGALCVADEVQVGFGRVGSHMWGFEAQAARPDIVTLGKPFGNGHPLAAVVTTAEVTERFAEGAEYFNTFGGNPVSAAVGCAVLDVIERERLQQRALEVGGSLLSDLRELAQRHAAVGDVRGLGLFLGVELVRDRVRKTPAPDIAHRVVERCRQRGILLSCEGPCHNVLKIKPPLCFAATDVSLLTAAVDDALRSLDT